MTALQRESLRQSSLILVEEYPYRQSFGVHAAFYHPHTGRERFPIQLRIQKLRDFMQYWFPRLLL